ncbi:MAG: hypothetical protein HQM08_06955 [Candidatus Riflebacteria bacterium]|nr:hypothetical protein [Candidatus Riflebacteria bacterium]
MAKKTPFSKNLKDKVLMVGYNPDKQCVYTAFLTIREYYDGEHPWDKEEMVKLLSIKTVHGYIFHNGGSLESEFESHFNLETGVFENGWSRNEKGVVTEV